MCEICPSSVSMTIDGVFVQIHVQSFGEMLLQREKGSSAHLQYLTDSLVF